MTEAVDRSRFVRELAQLTALDAVSGHERPVVEYLRQAFEPLADRVEVDPLGNLYAFRHGGNGPHLMVAAHSDEVGGLVSHVEPDGFLRFQTGLPASVLMGRKVRVHGHLGVIGIRPGHLPDTLQAPDLESLYIDLGMTSSEEIASLGIRVGDQVVWQSELEPTANADRVIGKAIDNRIGCLIVFELLRGLEGAEPAGDLTFVVAVQEEVGLKGARLAAERVRPDAALIVDTVPTADTPDARDVHSFRIALGRGPVLQTASGSGNRGFLLLEPVRDWLIELAETAGIPYQLTTFPFGNTDAASVYVSAGGIPTAAITIPRRYSHSPVEMLDLNDALATLRLCQQVIQRVAEFPRGMLDEEPRTKD